MKKYTYLLLQFVFCSFLFITGLPQSIHAQVEMDSLSNVYYEDGLNDIWGYVDESGNEYALVGVRTGVSIVDVTNAAEPKELFFIEGLLNTWRDLKTYQHYAYVISEAKSGLQIIDLQNLPMSIDTTVYIADSTLGSAHNIYIDERGMAYLSGFNDFEHSVPTGERGIRILDLKPNPFEPVFVHDFIHQYSHDAYVRGSTLLSSEIYKGQMMVADVSDPRNPVVLATHKTPNNFTHNAWLSDDGKVAFTTDERSGAFVTSYDISDLSDIRELDRYQSSPGENVMPHNVHVINDFLVISYYKDGVVIVDANEPDALVETEYYDTSVFSGSGSQGCWGAYPFLPSGNILASDREQGLFVLKPTYQRAAYIEGKVTDKNSGEAIAEVEVTIEGKNMLKKSGFAGDYKTGVAEAGVYAVRFYKYGYEPLVIEGVTLETAKISVLNAELQRRPSFDLTVEVVDKDSGEAIEEAQVELIHPEIYYNQLTGETGSVGVEPFYADEYLVLAYRWGWKTKIKTMFIDESSKHLRLELQKEYHDDFWLNFGWSVDAIGDMTGIWKRDVPKGTFLEGGNACNPDVDVQTDFSNYCFVTGSSGGELEDNDLDGGTTILVSPMMDLTDYNFPILSFHQWFCSSAVSDNERAFVKFELTNGIDTVDLQTIFTDYELQNEWHEQTFNVLEYLEATENVQLMITAKGTAPDVVIEAAIDAFRVVDGEATDIEEVENLRGMKLQIFPNPFDDQTLLQLIVSDVSSKTTDLPPLQIFDSVGRLVFQRDIEGEKSLDLNWGADAEAGLYFVKLGEVTKKVLKF